jgi:signal transduction histidine kinase
MRQLVDDITAYSLTDHSEQVFAVADLNAILEDVKEDLVEEIEKTNAHLEIHLLPQAVKVVPYQIQQLFYNLLSNSLKFTMAEMPLRISVTCQKVSAGEVKDVALHHGKDYYNIHVQDNGIGFDPSFNQRVFDIFYRLHAKEEYDGTGIGLAICKKIMENHNGAITAYGEQGKGARFSIFLPTT